LITASETLYPSARALIEEHFGSRIFDWYGQGEHMTFAGQCECGTYHLGEEYAITELVDAAGVPVDAGTGYIVGTCLHNYAMPLIRYLTDDIGIWQPKPCGCGRGLKGLSAVEGKQGDFVVTRSGRMVSAAVLYQCLLDSMNIEGAQFVQESNDALRLRLIAGPRYTADEGRCLARRVAKTCNGELAVAIEMVNDIPRTERGKHRLVIRRSTEALGLGPVASLHEEPY
jgi:phenylacetate-CoA ligase